MDDERSLIAVSARSNRSKADQDIAEWMVPDQDYTCTDVADWVAVKLRWGLTIDTTEQAALTDYAAACPDTAVTGTTAR